jgi:hypothetical protein
LALCDEVTVVRAGKSLTKELYDEARLVGREVGRDSCGLRPLVLESFEFESSTVPTATCESILGCWTAVSLAAGSTSMGALPAETFGVSVTPAIKISLFPFIIGTAGNGPTFGGGFVAET